MEERKMQGMLILTRYLNEIEAKFCVLPQRQWSSELYDYVTVTETQAGELDAIRLRIIKLREERERGEAEEY